jgi:hypothetical protein
LNGYHSNRIALRGWLVTAVLLHTIVTLWHGGTHVRIPVPLSELQEIFVLVIVILLPLIGLGMLWSRWAHAGVIIIALSMIGSLVFGFINHFVLISSDYVGATSLHSERHIFVLTAGLLLVTDTLGMVIGIAAWRGASLKRP